ncbi:nucleotide-binding protein [Candidatus Woesearchaeota archaeon]|nr:nucleotide-binding protein [Candidatus Woesearchaeota archaeon]
MKKKKVIIDTNFLLIPGQFKVDVFTQLEEIVKEPHQLCIIDKSINEVNKLAVTGKQKDRFSAKLALVLIRQKNLKTLHSFGSKKSVDDIIVKKADSNTYVATQDKALRKRLKEKGAKIIGLRQKKYLVIM